MSVPIRIAQVLGTVSTGGVASCVFNYYKHIDREKYQFDFYTYDKSPYEEEIKAMGGRIFYYPKVFNVPKCVGFLKKKFKENNYSIVHVHLTTLSFVPLLAAKKAKVPVRICHSHSTTHREEGFKHYVKNGLRPLSKCFSTHLFACSRLSADWLYGKNSDRAVIIRNAVELDRFAPTEAKRSQAASKYAKGDNKIVGFIGRFEFQKNVGFLVKAFAEVAKKRSNVKLALVGDGTQRSEIESLIVKLGLTGKVEIYPEQKEVEEYYSLFDVFALPSRFEGLPLVAVEAQAAGLPCLLSSCITKETDLTKKCLFLSVEKENSVEEWAERLLELLDEDVVNAEQTLKTSGYDIEDQAKLLENIYEKTL